METPSSLIVEDPADEIMTSSITSSISNNETNYTSDLSEIIDILFPDQDPDEQVQLGAEQVAYLSRLGSQGLESLLGEVARVHEELTIIEHQTREMASQNYQIFVQSAQTTNLIKKSLSDAKTSVEALSSHSFPSVKAQTDVFLSSEGKAGPVAQFQKDLAGVDTLFEKQGEVEEVLSMPWVVRRCVSRGDDKLLPDAIRILHTVMDYKKSTSESDAPIPPVLSETIDSVLDLQSQIQTALLLRLQSPHITLSECLQTIQLLRNFFPSDKALRFRFLQSRTNPHLTLENSRSWLFDTLTQHRAAFGQDSSHFLSTFISLQIQRVLGDVVKQLEHHPLNIDALFTNCTYFGESLARVGTDMRGLVVPLFSDFILKKTSHDLLQAEMNFSKNIHAFNLSTCLIQQKVGEILGTEVTLEGRDIDDPRPPSQLLAFSPLALYMNEVLSLFNFIGKCPLPQSVETCRKINLSVSKIGHELEAWGESEMPTWELKEQNLFAQMRSYYEQLLVPHLDRCVRKLFPPAEMAALTGLNVTKCAEISEIRYSRGIKV